MLLKDQHAGYGQLAGYTAACCHEMHYMFKLYGGKIHADGNGCMEQKVGNSLETGF